MLENTASVQLLSQYGYFAILAGTMLEGETVVLVAGVLAHQGYLSLPWIILAAIIGSSLSDQGLFFLSRLRGAKFLSRFPKAAAKASAMAESMRARPVALTAFALLFRFMYGLRNIAPIFLGMSGIPAFRFVCLNAVGAVLWATTFSCAGYVFARTLEAVTGALAKYEVMTVLALLAGGGLFAAYRHWKNSRPPGGGPSAS